ncbi:MAG: multidomain protein with s-layer y region, glug motif, ig motif, i-set domain, pkd domain [Clostridiales bacterium]|nr:multidomain protein with s-layer y region, glug motif, ig motif, i-set domain, pkd domain [Clostridiales bacterium]
MFRNKIKALYARNCRGIALVLCLALVLGLYIPTPVRSAGTGIETWAMRDCPTDKTLKSVTFGNDIFVAVGDSGTIIWSNDGKDWNTVTNSPTVQNLSSVVYGANVFVAVGEGGTIIKSGDGKNWALVQPSGDLNSYNGSLKFYDVTYSSKFIATGNWNYGGVFIYSNDGQNWSSFEDEISWTSGVYHGTDSSSLGIYGIAWGGNKYVGVGKSFDGYPLLIESTDDSGINWVNNKVLSKANTLYDVAYDGGTFYIVGNEGGIIKKSSGQSSWSAVVSDISNHLMGVAAHDGTVVAVGQSGRIFASKDNGESWDLKYTASGVYSLYSVTYGKNSFVAVGSNSGIVQSDTLPVIDMEKPTWPGNKAVTPSSTTGTGVTLNWTGASDNIAVTGYKIFKDGSEIASVAGDISTYNVSGLTAGTSYIFKVEAGDVSNNWTTDGPEVAVTTSTPITGWYTRTSGTTFTLYSVAYTGSNFVAVGDRGVILTSPDGINWTSRTSGTTNLLRGVAYAGGTLVAVGDGTSAPGSILYSTDNGQIWKSPDSAPNCILRSIAFGNGKFVAVGQTGITYTSDDGINWEYNISANREDQWGITYGNGSFMEINDNSTVRTSVNGTTWSDQLATGLAVKFGIGYGGGTFVATGPSGRLATSTNGSTWTSRNSGTVTTLRNIAYGNDMFVVAGLSDTILVSTNTRDWIPTSTNNYNAEFYGAAYGSGTFVVVGAGGKIVQSNNTTGIPEPTFSIEGIGNQTFVSMTAGYLSGTQQTKNLTIKRNGTGTLINVGAALSGADAGSFVITQPTASVLDENSNAATFTVKARDGLSAGTYTATVTITAASMTPVSFTVTQTVASAPPVADGEKPVWPGNSAVTSYGITSTSATLNWTAATDNVAVTGYKIFKDGSLIASVVGNISVYNVLDLEPGISYAFKVEAGDAMNNWSVDGPAVTVTTNSPALTYTIEDIVNQTFTMLTAGYVPGTQQTKELAITRNGTGTLTNLGAVLSGADAGNFVITQPATSVLAGNPNATTFTVKARDGLAEGTYTATVTITAASMIPVSFTVTQTVASTPPPILYSITFNSNGGSTEPNPTIMTAVYGGNVGTLPVPPIRPGYSFNGWNTRADGSGTVFTEASAVKEDITVYAMWILLVNNSGRDSSADPVHAPAYNAVVTGSRTGTTAPINVDSTSASGIVSLESLFGNEGNAMVTVPSIPGINAYTLEVPASSIAGSQRGELLTFSTDTGSITIQGNMLNGVKDFNSNKAAITIRQGDKSLLPADVKEALGSRPLVQITLAVDGQQVEWNNQNAPVTVSIPYTPAAAELQDPEHITVWYIDGSGNAAPVYNGKYNPTTGKVTFTTTHFSFYAVAYVQKTFKDLESITWAKKSIEVLASKGIISGTSKDEFTPASSITRADYLMLLVKTLGLTAEVNSNFDDVERGMYYYEAIGIARKLGITDGIGNNRFNPKDMISRQDMMVMTARALEKLKKLKLAGTSHILDKFNDKSKIAKYANESLEALVREGLVTGSGDIINPCSNTTRAEAAVFLHRIYNKY